MAVVTRPRVERTKIMSSFDALGPSDATSVQAACLAMSSSVNLSMSQTRNVSSSAPVQKMRFLGWMASPHSSS